MYYPLLRRGRNIKKIVCPIEAMNVQRIVNNILSDVIERINYLI